ncbi:MAG: YaeQ family protein [Gammaproteobacteria bacterium]|nr:YaeQ family protein [Gammaproteobacteria bacterium]
MALKSTVFKINLQISDMDRHYYNDHNFTIARHPSETDERMMLRIMIFAMHADEQLAFTKGLSTDEEPDLWQKNLSGEIDHWIDLGQPDEKRIRKACGLAKQVFIYSYSGSSAEIWWNQNSSKLQRFDNLSVINIPAVDVQNLGKLAQRNMRLNCTIEDSIVWVGNGDSTVEINPETLKSPNN